MADQLAPQFTATYGHPIVQTPHLDALAARGMRFDAAYTNSPLCAPARFSFMAGQLITKIKAYDNAAEFPASIPTFAHYLRQVGYRTCLSGKMHFVGPDQLHGFEDRLTTDVYPSDHAWTPNWDESDERIDKWYHNMDSVKEAGSAATTFQLEYDEEVAFTAKRRIFDYAKYQDTPFAMVVSFIHPHDPYVARPEFWDRYEGVEIDLPTSPIAEDPHSQRLYNAIEAADVSVTDEHSMYGKTFSTLGKPLKMISQDSTMFYNDVAMCDAGAGAVVLDTAVGAAMAEALGPRKALIHQNHGIITAGGSVDAAVWWFVALERCCQSQLVAEAAGTPIEIPDDLCQSGYDAQGHDLAGWFQFQPWWDELCRDEPEFLN